METRKKILPAAICLALGLSGCTSSYQPYQSERISDVQTSPHQQEVDLYFSGEWPKEDYVKIAALEVRGTGSDKYSDLVKALRKKGQQYGADAVIVQEQSYISDVSTGISSRSVSTTNTSVLHGIAIKLRSNLDMGLMPKVQSIAVYDKEKRSYEPLLNLTYTLGGEIKELQPLDPKALSSYENFVKRYALRHLLEEQGPEWTNRRRGGLVVKRERYEKGALQKTIEVKYNARKQPEKLTIVESGLQKEEILYAYSENGQPASRTILRDNVPFLYEKYAYDPSGKLEETQLFAGNTPEEQPILKSTFTYYTLEEIK